MPSCTGPVTKMIRSFSRREENVVGAFAAAGLFHDHGNEVHVGFR